jgi:branched-chain amino acid transport system substrate-binding protein
MAAQRSNFTRRQFLAGAGGAGAAGLVAGGLGGFFGGRASKDGGGGKGGGGGGEITVGAGVPVTGPFAGDGQEMLRGLKLGVDEINASGGVGGRQIQLSELDTKLQEPDVMASVMRKLVSDGVAAIFSPFTSYPSSEYDIVAEAGMPMFHVNTYQGNLDYVKEKGITNIYEGCPSQIWYGPGFQVVVNDIIASGAWTPASKTTAIVTSNDPYSLTIAQEFQKGMEADGWKTLVFEQFTIPQADWGPVLLKIRQEPPGVIFFSDYTPSDEASFMKQWQEAPTKSLVYQQYAPSVPEYLELAGESGNGVIWSTVIGGIFDDEIGKKFIEAYRAKYNQEPGLSNAGAQYDLIRLWAQAAAMAGDPYEFARVNQNVQNMVFRGVSGAFKFQPGELAPYPYPDKITDPSIGMPHLTFQIQDGKHVLISPPPYSKGEFQVPAWLQS